MAFPSPLILPLLAAALGACVGSFLNVVAWRLPREESLLRPASHCPHCGTPALVREPAGAGVALAAGPLPPLPPPIAPRYLLVELLTAGLWVAMLSARPDGLGPAPIPWLVVGAGWLLASWMVPLVLVDLDSLWLPEPLCRWGVLLGLAVTAVLGFSQGEVVGPRPAVSAPAGGGSGAAGLSRAPAPWRSGCWAGRPWVWAMPSLAALMGAWLGRRGSGSPWPWP